MNETEKLPVLWFGRNRAWKNPAAAGGCRMVSAQVVVRVLELRTQGADTVDERTRRQGVEQMERGDSEMTDRDAFLVMCDMWGVEIAVKKAKEFGIDVSQEEIDAQRQKDKK